MTGKILPPPPPLDSGRNPFELFVLGFSLIVGFPLLWGGAPAPGSTTALLGPDLALVWAAILVIGCLIALVGVWWTWWAWLGRWMESFVPRAGTGLLTEQVGLVAVGVGDVIYAVAVLNASPSRAIGAAIVGGFGLACWCRAWQIHRWVRAVIREQHPGVR